MRNLKSAAALAVVGLLAWGLMLVPKVESLWPDRNEALPILGILASLLLLAAIGAAAQEHVEAPPSTRRQALTLIMAAAALLVAGILFQKVNAVPAALLLLCGGVAVVIALTIVEQLRDGRSVELTSHWGGLGGAFGGWRLSPLVVTVLLALIFLGAAVAAGLEASKKGEAEQTTTNRVKEGKTDGNEAVNEAADNVVEAGNGAAGDNVAAPADPAANKAQESAGNAAAPEANGSAAAAAGPATR